MAVDLTRLPVHGGNLEDAQALCDQRSYPWIDVSAGISPWPAPIPDIPTSSWLKLTPSSLLRNFQCIAADYYSSGSIMLPPEFVQPIFGTQQFIALLPCHYAGKVIALPMPGYGSYAAAVEGVMQVVYYCDLAQLKQLMNSRRIDVVVVINPNNPTAKCLAREELMQFQRSLADDQLLVVDEAYADVFPEISVVEALVEYPSNLIILRSFGKFFGLPGARIGFLLAAPSLRRRFFSDDALAWLPNPSVECACAVMCDGQWVEKQKKRIISESQKMQGLMENVAPQLPITNAGLFCSLIAPKQNVLEIFSFLLEHGVYARVGRVEELNSFGEKILEAKKNESHQDWWLRFGLASDIALLAKRLSQGGGEV